MTGSAWRRASVAVLIWILAAETVLVAPVFAIASRPGTGAPGSSSAAPHEPVRTPAAEDVGQDPAADPAKVEIVEDRTESSRTFDNGDGTFTTELFADPIHYRTDGEDEWQAIEVGFESIDGARPESDLVAASSKSPVQVSIGANKRDDGFLVLEAGGRTYAVSLTAADASPPA